MWKPKPEVCALRHWFFKDTFEPNKLDKDDKAEDAEANEECSKTATGKNKLKRGVAEENNKSKSQRKI